MNENSEMVRVYSGTELTAELLKDELESIGILGMLKNEYHSGVVAGFSGGVPASVDVFILEADLKKAMPVIEEFRKTNS